MNNIYDDTMNNNEPDYEGNLVFPPQEESVEKKCERLKKQLKIAVEALKEVYEDTTGGHIQCDACNYTIECEGCVNQDVAEKALNHIKELDK